jgi:hypothetical protein
MTRLFTIMLLLFQGFMVPVQPGIEYDHKRLFRAIEREWGLSDPVLEELKVPDGIRMKEAIQGKFFRILGKEQDARRHYAYVGRVNSCRAGGCSVSPDEDLYGDSEYFDYFILFGPGPVVQDVQVYNYQATHGQEVSARGWLRQFTGYDGTIHLKVGKEVDAISGATISVYGITQDVMEKTRLLGELIHSL